MAEEKEKKDAYGLGRDIHEYVRLNAQHSIWVSSLGYHIHPDIVEAVKDRPNLRIADVATGSGIFIYELAQSRTFPESTQYDGFDISDAQFPAAKAAGNVKLQVLDMLETNFPEEFRNAFDVIHIRLVVLALPDGDPSPVLRNVYQMLKPGGYIQWEEYHYTGSITQRSDIPTQATDFLMQYMINNVANRWGIDWIDKFPAHLTASGYESPRAISHAVTGDFNIRYMSMTLLMASESLAGQTARSPDEEVRKKAEQMFVSIRQAAEEVKNGATYLRDLRVWIGKRGDGH